MISNVYKNHSRNVEPHYMVFYCFVSSVLEAEGSEAPAPPLELRRVPGARVPRPAHSPSPADRHISMYTLTLSLIMHNSNPNTINSHTEPHCVVRYSQRIRGTYPLGVLSNRLGINPLSQYFLLLL